MKNHDTIRYDRRV